MKNAGFTAANSVEKRLKKVQKRETNDYLANDVIDVCGEKCNVDWDTAVLMSYDNAEGVATYNIRDSRSGIGRDVLVHRVIDDIDERLACKFANPLIYPYAAAVHYNSSEYDPKNELWNAACEVVKKHPEKFFTKAGNFRKRGMGYDLLPF